MFKTKEALAASSSETQSYSSADVARLSGVSLRQLQWWDEQKVVSPQHDGHKRNYNMAEVVEVSVIAELRRKGFSLQKIRRVLRFLQKEMGRRLADILAPESDIHLLTDGKHIYLEEDHTRIVDVIKNAKQAMFVVSVSDQVRRLTATPRKPVRSETGGGIRKAKAV
ncbi:MAG TPA: MerR family transcriptional regulator [Bryobacteraceae bacterium]|nr:MerR family transcriptional regulator [Bryobacteraceae bacterium]HPT27400.1 MerR family transcriptional regulator [Bryobacteraceae bacterium]